MSGVLQIGQPPIEIQLRRKSNARRLTLRLAADAVFLTVPNRTPIREAEAFAIRQEGWLRAKLADRPTRRPVQSVTTIMIEGQQRLITAGTGRVARLNETTLEVPGPPDKYPAKIQAFLKELARTRLTAASDTYARQIDRSYNKLTLRDTRSRWGSCTSTGNLMYSWRLIIAPPEVLEYVAAHEVCHLAEMNHSANYWRLVEKIMPDYKTHRSWLRRNGAELHLIDFSG